MPSTTRDPPVLLLTRPAADAGRFAQEVRARVGGWRLVISPLIEIVPLEGALPWGTVPVLTSAHAVPFAGPGGGARAWCVGPRTAAAARAAGWDAVDGGGDADALVAAILASGEDGPFVHLRGAHARGGVAARLAAAGRAADERTVYDQRAMPLNAAAMAALAGPDPVVVPLFSPRTATLFVARAGNPAGLPRVVAMSAAVAQAAARFAPATLAERPTSAAMADAVARCLAIDALPSTGAGRRLGEGAPAKGAGARAEKEVSMARKGSGRTTSDAPRPRGDDDAIPIEDAEIVGEAPPAEDAGSQEVQGADEPASSEIVPASSVDLVPPPGETPPTEPPEPTAADAPDVIEVPPADVETARPEDAYDAVPDEGTSSIPPVGAGVSRDRGAEPVEEPAAVRPAPEPARSGGLGGMVLGGFIAGALGFALAWFLGQGPQEAARTETEALSARLAALEERAGPDIAPIEARVAELEGAIPDTAPLDARIAEIEGALGDVADTATLEAVGGRLSALEAGLAGLADAEPPAPQAPAATAEAVGAVEAVTGENADRLAALEDSVSALSDVPGALEGLRADLDALGAEQSGAVEALRAEIESVRAAVQDRQEAVEAERLALEAAAEEEARSLRAEAAITRIGAAIDTGAPLAEPLASWQEATGRTVPAPLAENAEEGVPSLAALQSAFGPAARAAIAAAPAAPGPAGFLRAQVGLRSLSEREGDDADAVLSRAQARLDAGELAAAVEAAGVLDGAPAQAMADWLERARTRLAAIDAAEGLAAPASTEG